MGITTRQPTDERELERELLRKGTERRDAELVRCDDCGRTPLIGEHIARYQAGAVRCELCRSVHREQPVTESLVKHAPDGPQSRVRVIRRLPV